jgi:SAM-dependent methyltransferase
MNTIVTDYLSVRKETFLATQDPEFQTVMKALHRFAQIGEKTNLLEIGIGTGWFQIRCLQAGIQCHGLEIDADLAECAREAGEKLGLPVDITIANLDNADLGMARYDVIVANSTFEHVKEWEAGLRKVARALKPGGVLYFGSTNKFTLRGGEYSEIPLYGWLPDRVRYWLRKRIQGDAIMEWGIDFNQFTFPQLRRAFKRAGFSRAYDLVEMLDADQLNNPTPLKRAALKTLQRVPLIKHPVLAFVSTTTFVCVR